MILNFKVVSKALSLEKEPKWLSYGWYMAELSKELNLKKELNYALQRQVKGQTYLDSGVKIVWEYLEEVLAKAPYSSGYELQLIRSMC